MKLLMDLLARVTGGSKTLSDKKRIIEGVVHSLIIQAGSVILILIGNLLMARWTGADDYGRYIHVFNWISILGVVALCGQEDLALAWIPRYLADGQQGRIPAFLYRSNRFIFISSLCVIVAFLWCAWFVPMKTIYDNRYDFLWASAAIYFAAFLALNQNVLQATHHIRLSQWVEKLIKPGLLVIFFLFMRWAAFRLDSRSLVILAVLVTATCCVVLAQFVRIKMRSYKADRTKYPAERTLGKMLHFLSIDLLYMVSTKITMLILPFFSQQKEVGIFNVSYRFADLVIFPFFLMNAVVPQMFAESYKAGKTHRQSLYRESSRLMLFLTIPMLLFNVAAGKFLLSWFGKDFLEGYPALVQLSIAQLFYALAGPSHTTLTMLDREKYAVWALLGYVLIVFAGNLVLVPSMGLLGGTLSVVIGSFCYNTTLVLLVHRFCGVHSYAVGLFLPSARRRSS